MSFDPRELPETPFSAANLPEDAPASGFAELGLSPEIVQAVEHAGYRQPTPVQEQAIPAALTGRDLLVSSQTGSGKTAAFLLPAMQMIVEARRDPARRRARGAPSGPRLLVLTPTRELALQVTRAAITYGRGIQGLRVASVVGGVPYGAQLKALRGPLDILIATPGRLLDLMQSGAAAIGQTEMLVLDEADRMLDLGFIDDIRAIAGELPPQRRTLMFSATFGGAVGGLAQQLTRDPQRITLQTAREPHGQIEQRLYWADGLAHKTKLVEHLLTDRDIDQALVFTSTQRDADFLAEHLAQIGHPVAALHGAMPQGRRNRVLQSLRERRLRVLVATDVAARGIDVPSITHVINYGLPMKAEDYVHRIGRTGRAGRSGLAITLGDRRDLSMIRRIERFTAQTIAVNTIAGLEPRSPQPVETRSPPPGRRPGPHPGSHRRAARSESHPGANSGAHGHAHPGERHTPAALGEHRPAHPAGKPARGPGRAKRDDFSRPRRAR